MSDRISLDAGIRSNLVSLQNTAKLLDRTQYRLSTGKEVNSPIDNPQNFFAARNLVDRGKGLNARLDAMGQSVQQMQTANHGIDTVRAMIANMKALVNDALTQSNADSRRNLGRQYNELLNQASLVVKDANYAGVNLLRGNQTLTIQFNESHGQSELKVGGINVVGPEGMRPGKSDVYGQGWVGPIVSVASQGAQASVASQASRGVSLSQASFGSTGAVASQASQASQAAIASIASAGAIGTFPSTASVASQGSIASQSSVASRSAIASSASVGSIGSRAAVTSQASHAGYASQASIGSYSYTDQFRFTLNVKAGEKGSNQVIGLKGHGEGFTGLGQHNVDFGAANFQSTLTSLLVDFERLDESLKTQSSRMTSNLTIVTLREDFTDKMINTLEEGADKLTLADMNEEGANLLSLQTRQSLGIQSLSLAAQSTQQLLRLLG